MMDEKILGNPDNASKRVPVALCLDTSWSMDGNIDELNQAVQLFYTECQNDEKAKKAVEVTAIEFGCHGVKIASTFNEIEFAQVPSFSAGNGTPMGEGVTLALDELEKRKAWYQDEGIDYYQPILVIMTDGHSGDDTSEASRRASKLVQDGRLTVVPLAFGNEADLKTLETFGQKHIKITDQFSFVEFFRWLSASASAMAEGQDIDLSEFF
jgi:uncharacterized protein YegL